MRIVAGNEGNIFPELDYYYEIGKLTTYRESIRGRTVTRMTESSRHKSITCCTRSSWRTATFRVELATAGMVTPS